MRSLILLLDSRLLPQKADKELLAFAASLSLPVLSVLTKADKCNKRELDACKRAWEALIDDSAIIVTSAQNKHGLDDLWQALLHVLF